MRANTVRMAAMSALWVSTSIGSIANATVMVQRTADELAHESDAVVVGTVGASHAQWIGGHIVTDVVVRVDETARGRVESSSITVRLPGGVVGETGQHVEGAPMLVEGERDVLFLHREAAGRYDVVALSQGVLPVTVATDGTSRVMPANTSGVALVAQSNATRANAMSIPPGGMPLAAFVREIATR